MMGACGPMNLYTTAYTLTGFALLLLVYLWWRWVEGNIYG